MERTPHSATDAALPFLGSLLLLLLLAPPLQAQNNRVPTLSNAEVEQVRDSRAIPNDSIDLFTKFLDLRIQELHDLYAHPRRPGREQDTHDLLEQFTAIADELSDNLDDYAPRHADLRKALPKLVEATERWSTAVKSPPENAAYNVSRRLALESIKDLHDNAAQLVDQQEAWFKDHPPSKQKTKQEEANEPITIYR